MDRSEFSTEELLTFELPFLDRADRPGKQKQSEQDCLS
jgi:hypothetical protein